jgi:Uma2 family endonuclease
MPSGCDPTGASPRPRRLLRPPDYREPDLAVYRRAASERGRVEPRDVALAIEVMSPGSVSDDRVAKPALYAAAGIPHFWQLELDPLVLVTHALAGDVYRQTGRDDDEVDVERPVRVRFRLADVLA